MREMPRGFGGRARCASAGATAGMQVTQDLAGFWSGSTRCKELSRLSRHAWQRIRNTSEVQDAFVLPAVIAASCAPRIYARAVGRRADRGRPPGAVQAESGSGAALKGALRMAASASGARRRRSRTAAALRWAYWIRSATGGGALSGFTENPPDWSSAAFRDRS